MSFDDPLKASKTSFASPRNKMSNGQNNNRTKHNYSYT